jgi:hypothetical protein
MKSFDISSPSQPEGSEKEASYFSNGLLSKIIHSDQNLARPTEHVLRRRWVNRMILAEVGFVLGVALLQFFPVIEPVSSAATITPTAIVVTATATATAAPSPTPIETAAVIVATASAELPPASITPQPAGSLPVALPDTGSDAWLDQQLYPVPLLCIGGGLVVWLMARARSAHDPQADASLPDGHSDDEGLC